MKKFFALILALTMAVSVSVTAFAAAGSETNTGADTSIPVSGTYNAVSEEQVVSVDISWEAMNFTYTADTKGTWNPSTHTYINATNASWSADGNKITVTNHSNVDVKAGFAFTKDTSITNELTGTFAGTSTVGQTAIADDGSVTLKAGVENQPDDADKVVATLTLKGSLPKDTNKEIGTVTVSISKATTVTVNPDPGWEGGFDVNF